METLSAALVPRASKIAKVDLSKVGLKVIALHEYHGDARDLCMTLDASFYLEDDKHYVDYICCPTTVMVERLGSNFHSPRRYNLGC